MLKHLLIALCLIVAGQLPAMNLSMGCNGDPIEREGILWQPIKYENSDEKRAVYAEMPGQPRTVFTNGAAVIQSQYEGAFYRLQILASDFPKDSKQIIKDMQAINGVKARLVKKFNKKKFKAVVAWENRPNGTLLFQGRVFVTSRGAYNFIVKGDFTLAQKFFESVEIVN